MGGNGWKMGAGRACGRAARPRAHAALTWHGELARAAGGRPAGRQHKRGWRQGRGWGTESRAACPAPSLVVALVLLSLIKPATGQAGTEGGEERRCKSWRLKEVRLKHGGSSGWALGSSRGSFPSDGWLHAPLLRPAGDLHACRRSTHNPFGCTTRRGAGRVLFNNKRIKAGLRTTS